MIIFNFVFPNFSIHTKKYKDKSYFLNKNLIFCLNFKWLLSFGETQVFILNFQLGFENLGYKLILILYAYSSLETFETTHECIILI